MQSLKISVCQNKPGYLYTLQGLNASCSVESEVHAALLLASTHAQLTTV
jgi:hypothetical protein